MTLVKSADIPNLTLTSGQSFFRGGLSMYDTTVVPAEPIWGNYAIIQMTRTVVTSPGGVVTFDWKEEYHNGTTLVQTAAWGFPRLVDGTFRHIVPLTYPILEIVLTVTAGAWSGSVQTSGRVELHTADGVDPADLEEILNAVRRTFPASM